MTDFRAKYGPWAVVAGASEGLGAAFAESLARRKLNLVLIARREALLNSLRNAGDFLIYVTIFCGPWLLVIIPVLYLIFRFIRGQIQKRREKRAAQAGQAAES